MMSKNLVFIGLLFTVLSLRSDVQKFTGDAEECNQGQQSLLDSQFTRSYVCDIAGLDKIAVVRKLWESSMIAPAAKMFTPDLAAKTEISDQDIREALKHGYIDYLNCRLMKVDVTEDSFDTYAYNKDNGEFAAEKIIASLRK